MTERIDIRLSQTDYPSGEIPLAHLAELASRLQELSTRVSRWAVDRKGPGRSPKQVEEYASLRLVGLQHGSTVLSLVGGNPDKLDIPVAFEEESTSLFWEVVEGIGSGHPPRAAPAGVVDSSLALLEVLSEAARQVEVSDGALRAVSFRPADIDRGAWRADDAHVEMSETTVAGVLEMVDLHSGRFRIRDDVGNGIRLDDVSDPIDVAKLVGQRAIATGVLGHGSPGQVSTMSGVTVIAAPGHDWGYASGWDVEALKPGPDPDGGVVMSDEEFGKFLAAARGSV